MTEKISVLIPTFNRELYIKESLASILKQTYKNLDILIYDDGSTDETINIIESIKDKRIQLIKSSVNKGVGHARKELIDACQTKYACWHDSDDISQPKRIEFQYKEMKRQEGLIFTRWYWLVFNNRNKWSIKKGNTHNNAFATLMFPVDKNITFNPKIKLGGEDWDWIKRMEKKYKTALVPRILYLVRSHEDRIGQWKRKFRKNLPKELLGKLSYKELIEYYKNERDNK